MVVLAGQRVEVNHHIFLHCNVVHHVDEVQQGLRMQTQTKSVSIDFFNPGFSTIFNLFFYSFTFLFAFQVAITWFNSRFGHFLVTLVSSFGSSCSNFGGWW